jgi:type I restriction enzyme, R subunit
LLEDASQVTRLIQLIEKQRRKSIYTDFEDQMGGEATFELPGLQWATDYAKSRFKGWAFPRVHEGHVAINKLRLNKPLDCY